MRVINYYIYLAAYEHVVHYSHGRHSDFFFFFESSIIKPTTLNTNEQEAIGNTVADPGACVVSMPPKYQLCS